MPILCPLNPGALLTKLQLLLRYWCCKASALQSNPHNVWARFIRIDFAMVYIPVLPSMVHTSTIELGLHTQRQAVRLLVKLDELSVCCARRLKVQVYLRVKGVTGYRQTIG